MEASVIAWDCGEAPRGSRDALVLNHLEAALAMLCRPQRRDVADFERPRSPLSGLEKICPMDPLIVFGCSAHIGLADFEKTAIVVDDLRLSDTTVDIERLVWSSANTIRAIALGEPAWRSIQFLPLEETCFFRMPPIAMDMAGDVTSSRSIRIINHTGHPNPPLEEALRRAGFEILAETNEWSDDAALHLHVGIHDWDAREPRLIDSWRSGKLVVDFYAASGQHGDGRGQILRVEHEANGLSCGSIGEVVAACKDVCADRIFWKKLVRGGQNTAAPLSEQWRNIAVQTLS